MNYIQQIREKKHFTQEKLAVLLGIERSTIAKWETGKSNPRAEMLPKIANILGCTIDELMREGEGSQINA